MNDLIGRSPNDTTVNELKINDSNITPTEEIANAFNEYFTNIGPNLANSIDDSNSSLKHLLNLLNLKWIVLSWCQWVKYIFKSF
jgi:hypothetical protein